MCRRSVKTARRATIMCRRVVRLLLRVHSAGTPRRTSPGLAFTLGFGMEKGLRYGGSTNRRHSTDCHYSSPRHHCHFFLPKFFTIAL